MEREEISRGLAAGWSLRAIARHLERPRPPSVGRSPATAAHGAIGRRRPSGQRGHAHAGPSAPSSPPTATFEPWWRTSWRWTGRPSRSHAGWSETSTASHLVLPDGASNSRSASLFQVDIFETHGCGGRRWLKTADSLPVVRITGDEAERQDVDGTHGRRRSAETAAEVPLRQVPHELHHAQERSRPRRQLHRRLRRRGRAPVRARHALVSHVGGATRAESGPAPCRGRH